MNNFLQRILTGILFVIVVAGGIIYHPFAYFVVFFLVVIAGIYELNNMLTKVDVKINFLTSLSLGVFIYLAVFLVNSGISQSSIYYLIIPLVSLIFISELFNPQSKPLSNIGSSLLGAVYLGASFAMMHVLGFQDGVYNYKLPLSVFILVWVNDSGAYVSGISIGKHKFFERISPKKTWEGTIGGFVFTLIGAYIISLYWTELNSTQWIIFGGIISVMAALGDLVESMFKRHIGIKDSGNILPGHGGILDRFDAVIFALPMAVFYIKFFVG